MDALEGRGGFVVGKNYFCMVENSRKMIFVTFSAVILMCDENFFRSTKRKECGICKSLCVKTFKNTKFQLNGFDD